MSTRTDSLKTKTKSTELYKIMKNDIKAASLVLGKAFHNDPIWSQVIPDEDERKEKLTLIFEMNIIYSLKYGSVYASSENLEGIIITLPNKKAEMTFWRLMRSGAFKIGAELGREAANRIEEIFKPINEDRKRIMKKKPYDFFQTVGVSPEHQGQGFGGKIIRATLENADNEGISLYLETETEDNVRMYERYGFKVLKEVKLTKIDRVMWQMAREPAQH